MRSPAEASTGSRTSIYGLRPLWFLKALAHVPTQTWVWNRAVGLGSLPLAISSIETTSLWIGRGLALLSTAVLDDTWRVARQRAADRIRRLAMPERSGCRQWSRRPRSWKWPLPVPIEMLIPPLGSSQLPNALLTFTVPVW